MKAPPPIGRRPLELAHVGLLAFLGATVMVPLAGAMVVNTLFYGGGWIWTVLSVAIAVLIVVRLVFYLGLRVTVTGSGIEYGRFGRAQEIAWRDVLVLHTYRTDRRAPRYLHVRLASPDGRRLRFFMADDEHAHVRVIQRKCTAAVVIDEEGPIVRSPRPNHPPPPTPCGERTAAGVEVCLALPSRSRGHPCEHYPPRHWFPS